MFHDHEDTLQVQGCLPTKIEIRVYAYAIIADMQVNLVGRFAM